MDPNPNHDFKGSDRQCRISLFTIFLSHTLTLVRFRFDCAAGFALLNLPKGKSLGRSKPETNSDAQALATHCVGFLLYPSLTELPSIEIK